MTTSHILGFPRVGAKRELKFAQERYWRKELAEQDLLDLAKALREKKLETSSSGECGFRGSGRFHVLRSYFRFTSGNRGNSCSFWF